MNINAKEYKVCQNTGAVVTVLCQLQNVYSRLYVCMTMHEHVI
jgi:hypothetical protein